jgi:hypothetical protein
MSSRKTAVTTAAVAVLAGLAACTSAAKPASTAPKTASATEAFVSAPLTYAQLMSPKSPIFDLTYSGKVTTTGTFSPGNGDPAVGQRHSFLTKDGTLVGVITAVPEDTGKNNTPALLDAASCRYGGVTKVDFKLVSWPKTGPWKVIVSGTGSVSASYGFSLPVLKKPGAKNALNPAGKCDLSQNARPLRSPAPSSTFDGKLLLVVKSG